MVTANSFTCTLFFTNAYVLNTVSRESQSNGSHKELQINANNQFALWSIDCAFSFVVLAQLQLRAHLQVDRDELACWTKRRAEQAPNRRLSCSTTKKKSKKSKSKSNRKKVKWSEKDLLTSLGNYQSTKCISLNHSSQNIRWKTTFTKSTQSALQLFGFKLIICFIKKKSFMNEWKKLSIEKEKLTWISDRRFFASCSRSWFATATSVSVCKRRFLASCYDCLFVTNCELFDFGFFKK